VARAHENHIKAINTQTQRMTHPCAALAASAALFLTGEKAAQAGRDVNPTFASLPSTYMCVMCVCIEVEEEGGPLVRGGWSFCGCGLGWVDGTLPPPTNPHPPNDTLLLPASFFSFLTLG
jgi:hypothetical protein